MGDGWGRGGGGEGWGEGSCGQFLAPFNQPSALPPCGCEAEKQDWRIRGDRGEDRTECVSVGKKEAEVEDEKREEMRSTEVKQDRRRGNNKKQAETS